MQLDFWNPTPAGERTHAVEEPSSIPWKGFQRKSSRSGSACGTWKRFFSALKENLNQILGNLQDGILLFTGDGRAVLVSEAAHRFLDIHRDNILGLHASEIFDRSTVLGRMLRDAFDAGAALVQEEVHTETGRRIQASVDFIYDDRTKTGFGALVTLHDLSRWSKLSRSWSCRVVWLDRPSHCRRRS